MMTPVEIILLQNPGHAQHVRLAFVNSFGGLAGSVAQMKPSNAKQSLGYGDVTETGSGIGYLVVRLALQRATLDAIIVVLLFRTCQNAALARPRDN
jgi:hypothetical protein